LFGRTGEQNDRIEYRFHCSARTIGP
jgi:hypothetical protein